MIQSFKLFLNTSELLFKHVAQRPQFGLPIFVCLFFSLVINVLLITSSIYSLQVFDRVLSSRSVETLWMLTGIAVFALLCAAILMGIRRLLIEQSCIWLNEKFYEEMGRRSLIVKHSENKNMFDLIMGDLDALKQMLLSPGFLIALDLPWSIIYVIVLWMLHPFLALTVLVGIGVMIFFTWLNHMMLSSLQQKIQVSQEASVTHRQYSLETYQSLKSMGMASHFVTFFINQLSPLWDYNHKLYLRSSVLQSATRFFRLGLQLSITLISTLLVLKYHGGAGIIVASSILAGKALSPFDQIEQIIKLTKQANFRLTRIFSLINKQQDQVIQKDLPMPKGHLVSKGIGLQFLKGNSWVLKNCSFELKPGDSIGVIGPTGSGKSSLCKCCIGMLNPQVGSVRLDGVSLEDWCDDEVGASIGYLGQEVPIFDATIKQNIARLDMKASMDDILEAAMLAQVHDLILSFPDGYETKVGSQGFHLSQGQKQRIGLARAFYKKPALIVLDEPNANLDQHGEIALSKALQNITNMGSSVMIVSHRPQILSMLKYLIVMVKGEIKDYGETKDILTKLQNSTGRSR